MTTTFKVTVQTIHSAQDGSPWYRVNLACGEDESCVAEAVPNEAQAKAVAAYVRRAVKQTLRIVGNKITDLKVDQV